LSFEDFEQSIESDALKRVARHWRDVRGARAMPGWNHVRPSEIAAHLSIIWSYTYDRETDTFTGRLAGQNIEQMFGKSFKGTPMVELYPKKDYQRLFDRAKRVVSGPEFYRGTGMVFRHLDHSGDGERIMLPLANDGIHGDGLLGATVYRFYLGNRSDEVPETDGWFAL
jgi:hypothetical protein